MTNLTITDLNTDLTTQAMDALAGGCYYRRRCYRRCCCWRPPVRICFPRIRFPVIRVRVRIRRWC